MLTGLKRKLRHNEFFWRFLFNFKASAGYFFNVPKLSDIAQRVVKDLNKNGVAFASSDELFADKTLFNELQKAVETLDMENMNRIDEARNNVNNFNDLSEKTFMLFLLGFEPKFEAESIWNRFATQAEFRNIADAYFRMKNSEMRYYNIWHTIPYNGEARASQLWHRDREDMQILKIFVYFTDVDSESGPFTYAPGTHVKGPIKKNPDYHMENGTQRTTDEQMAAVVPFKNWVSGTVKKFTIAFADTHGYHKGGFATKKDRILFTCMYVSPDCQRELFSYN
jgi:hypothetical protein